MSTDGVTFGPNLRDLFWNTEMGVVAKLTLDGSGNVVSAPTAFANLPGVFMYGMTTDVCGNVYAVDMGGRIMRINPNGQVIEYADLTSFWPFISAVNFGTGVGGWERDHLYVMDIGAGGLFEIDAGVPGKREPHW